jgi:tripartite-type tricarboxylate transporter receptor subunit TctC
MTNISRRRIAKGLAATLAAPALVRSAFAQSAYPGSQQIKVIVPYPAGGATDVIGRIVADRLANLWGTTVIVENIPGAGANIGMDRVAKGPQDGSQILMVPPNIATNQFLYAKMNFDPERDILPIAQVTRLPNILVVKKGLEVNSVKDLIAYAKANPGKLNYASSGVGTTIHLSAELFKRMAGVDMVHVAYRGSAPAVNDLVAGQVDVMFDNATSIVGQVKGGTVKALGITSLNRSPLLPEIPPISETIPGYDTGSWFGVGVRAGTPKDIVDKIEQAAQALTKEAIVKERMAPVIAEPVVSDQKSFAEHIAAERKKWGTLITDLKIKAE